MVAFFINVFSIIYINWLTAMYKMCTFIFSTWIEFACSLSTIYCFSDSWIFKIYCIISIDIPKVVQDNWLPFFGTTSAITKHFQNFLLFIHPSPNFKLYIIFESNVTLLNPKPMYILPAEIVFSHLLSCQIDFLFHKLKSFMYPALTYTSFCLKFNLYFLTMLS